MAASILTAAAVARFSRFYRDQLHHTAGRDLPLDGLRGMAALLVMTHHSGMAYTQIQTGQWGDAGSPVLQLFGPVGVVAFFMLTGHLFWGKARAVGGKFNLAKLWRGRLFRIGPLYLFSIVVILAIATMATGSSWVGAMTWRELASLLALGARHWTTLGGMNPGDFNGGVEWTLWYEWRFYLALPFIAWLAVGRRTFWLAALAYSGVVTAAFFMSFNLQPLLIFLLGMLCPVLLAETTARSTLRQPIAAALALSATVALCAVNWNPKPVFAIAGSVFPLFLVVASGNSIFGFLTSPAIRCLGTISYSLYLLHFTVFSAVFLVLKYVGLSDLLRTAFWPIVIASSALSVLLCSLTYRWIEHPFMSSAFLRNRGPKAPQPPMADLATPV